MERIQTLINRLQEQVKQNADVAQMQLTLQLLQSELNKLQKTSVRTLGTSKVSVVLPTPVAITPISVTKSEQEEVQEVISAPKARTQNNNQLDIHFDPMNEIPTFSQHKIAKEVNETVGHQESFNDRLKENRTELMHSLKESPIRDLRKGIGINDRFVFISELFRGDEPMYERSIKTINSFNIYPEAEYWMNRELKIKLGWDDTKEIVKHFYNLVKRRFASM
ncbi:MAG TPA: hypothetical protein VHQ93_18625 [Chitinophagaceae bacterium]|jgi:hypothetical protein|nr:hypothetical protein [Chitinophagaceae bacterium]